MGRDGKVVRMSHQTPATHRPLTTALAEAAAMAGHAPSVHNSQPWRWRVLPDALELRMVRDSRLAATDPEGELVTLALHHGPRPARPAHRAAGHRRRPGRDAGGAVHAGAAHRPASGQRRAGPRRLLERHRAAAVQEGARLEVLDRDQVLQLAASASQAATVEAEDSRLREELEYWTSRAGGTGLTPEVLPEQPAQTTVPGRDFGRAGTLPVGPGHDRAASYAVLYATRTSRSTGCGPARRCRPPGWPPPDWVFRWSRSAGGRGAGHPADPAPVARRARPPVPRPAPGQVVDTSAVSGDAA